MRRGHLTVEERHDIIKLLWLVGQLPERTRKVVAKRFNEIMRRQDFKHEAIMAGVRDAITRLERAMRFRD
jgi:hypothetical protein